MYSILYQSFISRNFLRFRLKHNKYKIKFRNLKIKVNKLEKSKIMLTIIFK